MPRSYFWLVARDEQGKPYLISAAMCKTEAEARQRGLEMLQGLDFKIRRFPTVNLQQASAYMRGKRLASGQGLSRSTQRQGHERSLKRRQNKRRIF